MDYLTHLPIELTSGILTHLALPDLLVLLRVNKTLNQLGEQILYQDLELTWSCQDRNAGRLAPQSSFHKLHTVLINILRRPQRSAYVQHLHIDVGKLENVWGPTGETRLSEAERELLRGGISPASVSSPAREAWFEGVLAGVPNAYIGLLLSQLPGIKSLFIGHPARYSHNGERWTEDLAPRVFFPYMDADATDPESTCPPDLERYFPLLEQFRYMPLPSYSYTRTLRAEIEAQHFLPFLNAPHMKSMSLYLFTTQEIFANVPHTSATLTELILHKFLLDTNQLGKLLRATPNLLVLRLDYWIDCGAAAVGEKPHLDIPHLFHVLHPVQNSLRELQLSTRFFGDGGVDDGIADHGGDFHDATTSWGLKGAAPSLEGFRWLQVLEVPTAVLLGWDHSAASSVGALLPSTLLRLVLRDDLWAWKRYTWDREVLARALQAFMGSRCRFRKELQGVTLTDSDRRMLSDGDKKALARLELLFHGEGLNFDLARYEDDKP
ncbi:hypothetical protein LARI1_G006647 [Lachnellula arida]|uniref:F-box domain-containing protein n=1 Tax=Lachnellula arida TaxID=1316785 RepID=A0A8T9BAE8_9HELO|nr:hypothetical protein LARI1_G006647 [Lachnellula arida]